ncbi:speckle targeted PIP5K1A-regulated poly(A) polymerase-like [Anticarsia gemmatalis]|uniref:speckle targeted PIP5K1A-regulated poly(A) polymerase-like n=1 Tax=Anticarsia gemmatalis TaxID=129554 RepID=UPI003F7646FB
MDLKGEILNTRSLCFEGDFDSQIERLFYRVRLTANEVQNLRLLFSDLELALQSLAPGLQVMPFGSIVTGLGIKTSDVDCYIALPDGTKPNPNYVILARNILRRYHRKFSNLFAIVRAKVPIVKFLHIPTKCYCDVNFKSPAGVQNSELIAALLHMDSRKRALPLAILIKYWSKVNKISGTNLLASYALTLMVVFYLQVMNILPSVVDMQRNSPPHLIDNWNTAFSRDFLMKTDNDDTLYELAGGFFKCYANLNFNENIISPFMGRLIQKKLFQELHDVPKEFDLYAHNVRADLCKPLNIVAPFCVQDPFELSRNTSASVFPKLAERIDSLIKFAAQKFDEVPPEKFLKTILTEQPVHVTQFEVKRPTPRNPLSTKVTKVKTRKTLHNRFSACYEQINKLMKNKKGPKWL